MSLVYVFKTLGEWFGVKIASDRNAGDTAKSILNYALKNTVVIETIKNSFPIFTAVAGIIAASYYFVHASKLEISFWTLKKRRIREMVIAFLATILLLVLNLSTDGLFRKELFVRPGRAVGIMLASLILTAIIFWSLLALNRETAQLKKSIWRCVIAVLFDYLIAFISTFVSCKGHINIQMCLAWLFWIAVIFGFFVKNELIKQEEMVDVYFKVTKHIFDQAHNIVPTEEMYYCYFRDGDYVWCGTKKEIDQDGNSIRLFDWKEIIEGKVEITVVNKLE